MKKKKEIERERERDKKRLMSLERQHSTMQVKMPQNLKRKKECDERSKRDP